jgi:hypothetical protein
MITLFDSLGTGGKEQSKIIKRHFTSGISCFISIYSLPRRLNTKIRIQYDDRPRLSSRRREEKENRTAELLSVRLPKKAFVPHMHLLSLERFHQLKKW